MTGDCLLHADHHEMRQECWRAVVEFFVNRETGELLNDRDAYKLDYERAVLLSLISLPLDLA